MRTIILLGINVIVLLIGTVLMHGKKALLAATIELIGDAVVIADSGEEDKDYEGFNYVERLQNDELIIVYYVGKEHVDQNSFLELRRSSDYGQTWSEPITIVKPIGVGHGVREAMLTQLNDGTLILSYQ